METVGKKAVSEQVYVQTVGNIGVEAGKRTSSVVENLIPGGLP